MRNLFILTGFSLLVGCASSQVDTDEFDYREPASYSGTPMLVKEDRKAANGDCLKNKGVSTNILKKYKMQTWSGSKLGRKVVKKAPLLDSDKRRQALAKIYTTIDSFKSKKFNLPGGQPFVFGPSKGGLTGVSIRQARLTFISEGRRNAVPMRDRDFGGTDNHALLAHMLAYQIANQTYETGTSVSKVKNVGTVFYDFVGGERCPVSRYALRPGGGRTLFAEAFAAYLTNPNLLNKVGCKKTFAFMKDLFGETNNKITCARRQKRFNSGVDSLIEEAKGSGIDGE